MKARSYKLVGVNEQTKALAKLNSHWSVDEGKLRRSVVLSNYIDGARALLSIAEIADAANHHPELGLGFKTLRIELYTHDARGLTNADFELAEQIDTIIDTRIC